MEQKVSQQQKLQKIKQSLQNETINMYIQSMEDKVVQENTNDDDDAKIDNDNEIMKPLSKLQQTLARLKEK